MACEALREALRKHFMGPRLKDIAQALNISISTASYALNGGPRQVPPEVRDRVIQKARDMGYRPNRVARSLAAGRTMTLGVVPVVMGADFIANPYFQGCFSGIATESKSFDYDVLLYTHDALDATRLEDVLLDGRSDGLVFLAPFKELSALERMEKEGVPFAIISGESRGSAPSFKCDNSGGIRRTVEHLVALGHRKLSHFAGDVAMADGAERLDGFVSALASAGISVREDWILCEAFSTEQGYRSGIELLSRTDRPTAIVCASDEIAAGVYRAAWELSLKIPDDLSVTGFDDATLAQLLLPHLTTVRQPFSEMGQAATRAVIDLIAGKKAGGHTFNTELVIRQSTARPMEVLI
jgi:LacI family transcriptional regulator, galactose operon repressor